MDVTEGSTQPDAISPDLIECADGLARPPWAAANRMLQEYYDTEWGMPIRDEQGVYERLCLEAFQSGLSWALVLSKRDAFRHAFARFDPEKVANFCDQDIERLLENPKIIRNRAKIEAAIANAKATLSMREEGGLAALVWSFQPDSTPRPFTLEDIPKQTAESVALSKALKKRGCKFVGPVTAFALMEAIGMVDTHLVGSHRRGSSGVWA
ncbi:3-methyladenine DNA glycosylase [Corynebacterium phocae]|uniref:3-methyladenine DNA glycosylase n=1 Tax=Corynebacterium phocae TaxID=161895 RepID=A0A1L7D4M1_9CORY|nr:3-methyladenine DNA glycosylase [Corynebacterium phocae]